MFRQVPAGLACLLAACGAVQPQLAIDPDALAPPTSAKSWARGQAAQIPGAKATLDAFSAQSIPTPAAIESDRVYDLSHLIDLALRTNPETAASWQATRAAASRVGISEGRYLPTLTAIAMANDGHFASYDRNGPFATYTGALEPLLRLDWLLLDFGRRSADVDSAAQTLLAANLQFNRVQQDVIFAVQKAYFTLDASRARVTAREKALEAATAVEQATDVRSRSGLASVTDTLLAHQVVLQQQFDIASARRDVSSAEAQLAQAIGLSPAALPRIASMSALPLPKGLPASLDSLLAQSVSARPDVVAKFAVVRAREAELERARADYLPTLSANGTMGKVYREFESLSPGAERCPRNQILELGTSAELGTFRWVCSG